MAKDYLESARRNKMKAIKAVRKTNKRNVFCTGGIGGSVYTEFKVGEIYEIDGPLELCGNGYHYYRKQDFVFGLFLFGSDTCFIEIEVLGEVKFDTEKRVTNKLKVIRYIPKKEWKRIIKSNRNSGHSNSGHSNSGDRNSGHRNSGDSNSGHSNSGHRNSGDSNSGHRNSGHSNSGHRNSGHRNSGHRNSGHSNSGDSNSGNWNSGDNNSGNWNSGDSNSGHSNSGDSNSGNWNSGDNNSGNWNSGHRNSGDNNSGDSNSGHRNSGDSNSGHRNSGHSNSGHRNSGHSNSGDNNSGNWNSGDNNSGNWNSCDFETGYFNLKRNFNIRVFNKPCEKYRWDNAVKPDFIYFELVSDKSYKECFIASWDNTTEEDRRLVETLPNFDWEVFTEISGIKKPEDWD